MGRSGSGRRGSEGELGWDVRSGASTKGRREGTSKSPGFSFYPGLFFALPYILTQISNMFHSFSVRNKKSSQFEVSNIRSGLIFSV